MSKWKKRKINWYETNVISCELCGQVLTQDIWVSEIDGVEKWFCSPSCERLYLEYWLPKYKGRKTESKKGLCKIEEKKSYNEPSRNIDNVSMIIIGNNLSNICEGMGVTMMRTAYSPIFSESKDFSCVICNTKGEIIAQGEFCPAQLGAITFAVKWTIMELGLDSFNPGDIVLHNDPYRGGVHIPEHLMIKPIFYKNRLFGFAAIIAHVTEIGGKAYGAMAADATDIYQEGLRLPPIKIIENGEHVKDNWKIILSNHRTPKNTWGDFHAMIAALDFAEKRLIALFNKYSLELVNAISEQLMDYSERRMRLEIKEIPDGEYFFEDCIEDDGVVNKPAWIRCTIVIKGDELIADFTGSDPQTRGPANGTFGVTASALYNAVFSLTDFNILRNSGCYRPIHIIAPPGTIVNVQHPAPDVGGNSETHPRIVDVIFGAMSKVLPDRVSACSGSTGANLGYGGIYPGTREMYSNGIFEGMGWGGTSSHDGLDGTNNYNGNCRNNSVEVLETRYPILNLQYSLVKDSGGAGKYRGGLGLCRVIEVLDEEMIISCLFDRVKIPPWGLFGGKDGKTAGFYIRKRNDKEFKDVVELYNKVSPSKFTGVILNKGDVMMFKTPGGGGYGDPLKRGLEKIIEDIKEKYISLESAYNDYGVVVRNLNGELVIDKEETETLRKKKHKI